jgi:hypothetical protein
MKSVDNMKDGFFPITSVHRDDIVGVFRERGRKKLSQKAKKLTDAQMEYIARKLADDYCTQLFWDSLEIIAKRVIKNEIP